MGNADGMPINAACRLPGPGEDGEVRSLVLRAWLEPRVQHGLRARVVEITPDRREHSVIVTTSVEEACRAVRDWLEALRAQGTGEGGDGSVTREG